MAKFKEIPIGNTEYKIWVFNDEKGYRYQLYKDKAPVKAMPKIEFTYEEAEDMNTEGIFQNKCDELVHDFFAEQFDETGEFTVDFI